jgi:hypothetical protein
MRKIFKNKQLAIILLALSFVVGYYFFGRANPSAQVEFTADTNVSLSGINNGDLQIGSGSECASLSVSGASLSISAIPDGATLTLKTPQHANALKLTPAGGNIDLSINSANMSAGNISRWTLSSSGSVNVNHIVGVANANTNYDVKIDNVYFSAYTSNSASEISFNYSGSGLNRVFTIAQSSTGGGGLPPFYLNPPTPPAPTPENPEGEFKVIVPEETPQGETTPSGKIKSATSTASQTITLKFFAGPNVKKMAISEDPQFKDAPIEPYQPTKKWTLSKGAGKKTIYVKFFTEYGVPSKVVSIDIFLLPSSGKPSGVELIPTSPRATSTIATPTVKSGVELIPTSPRATSTIATPTVKFAPAPAKKIKKPTQVIITMNGGDILYKGLAGTFYGELSEKIVEKFNELASKIKIITAEAFNLLASAVDKITPDVIKKGAAKSQDAYSYVFYKIKVGLLKFILAR